jgi:hypothetical protein
MAASDVMTRTGAQVRSQDDDNPTWTDILREIAVRKRRDETSPITAAAGVQGAF